MEVRPPVPFPDTQAERTSADSSGESKVAGIGDFFNWMWPRKSAPPTQESKPEEPKTTNFSALTTNYPTREDAEFARKYEYAYGKEWEPFFNNAVANIMGRADKGGKFHPTDTEGYTIGNLVTAPTKMIDLTRSQNAAIKEELKDVFARAALATNRSGLATLGFSPSRTMMDVVSGKNDVAIAGMYDQVVERKQKSTETQANVIYSNLAFHDAIVHESIHRGFELLKQRRPEETKALLDKMGVPEEYAVRQIMRMKMGNIEQGLGEAGDEQIETAKKYFDDVRHTGSPWYKESRDALEALDALAAEEVAKKRPGGPR